MPPPAPPTRPNKPQIALPMGEKAAAEVIPNASPTPDPNERWAPPRAATPSYRRSVAPSGKKTNGAGDISIAVQTQAEHSKFIENRRIKMWAARQPWLGLVGDGWRSARAPSTPNHLQSIGHGFNQCISTWPERRAGQRGRGRRRVRRTPDPRPRAKRLSLRCGARAFRDEERGARSGAPGRMWPGEGRNRHRWRRAVRAVQAGAGENRKEIPAARP